jgi:phospholipid transport system substrate-binding protein
MIASLLAATLLAAAPVAPLKVVENGNAAVQKAASAPGATAQSLSTVVESFVDFKELSKRSLGKHWETLKPAQQTEFTDAMTGLLRASYAQKALGQAKADVQYGKESVQGNEATVPTTLTVKTDKVPVNYKLHRPSASAEWRIYDVITDGVSLEETYAGQFKKLLSTKGFDGLLTTLKNKRAQLEKENASKTAASASEPTGTGGAAQTK